MVSHPLCWSNDGISRQEMIEEKNCTDRDTDNSGQIGIIETRNTCKRPSQKQEIQRREKRKNSEKTKK